MIVTDETLLRQECRDTSIFEGMEIVAKLQEQLKASSLQGIGLAANQIGIDAKVCIIRASKAIDLINPVIVEKLNLMEFDNEGCLSFPNEWVTTQRYSEIVVKDLLHPNGVVATGLEAVVIQHEVGHLYGETMYDYQIKRPGPNLKCWCGSGKKYKKCHMGKVING